MPQQNYPIVAQGPIQGGPFAQLLQGSGTFLGQAIGGRLAERKLAKDLNPMRAALEQSIAAQQQAGVQHTPQQQMIATAVPDPRAFARMARSHGGALGLGGAFEPPDPADVKPAHWREFVVRHDSELNTRYELGLAAGDTATIKVPYDANDQEMPGHEIEQFNRAGEGGADDPALPFGAGLRGRTLQYATELSPGYAEKGLTPEDERKLYTSVSELLRPEVRVDPDTGLEVRRPGAIPPYVRRALMSRPEGAQFLAQVEAAWDSGVAPPLGLPGAAAQPVLDPNSVAAAEAAAATLPTIQPESAIPPQDPGAPSLWEMTAPAAGNASSSVTGPIAAIKRGTHRLPIVGSLAEFPQETEAGTYVSGVKERLIDGLRRNPRYAEGEAERLFAAIDIKPGFIDTASSFQSRIIGFDDVLQQIESEMQEVVTGRREVVSGETRQHAMDTLQIVKNTRQILAPPRMSSFQQAQEFIRTGVPGTKFLFKEDGNWVLYTVDPR